MNVDDLKFGRRKVLQGSKLNEYSSKNRWDQGSFGSQRTLLLNHVQNTLRQHQNDGDILDKFRKQAEQLKERKRKQKFPHLYPSLNFQQNRSFISPKLKQSSLDYPMQQLSNKMIVYQPQNRIIQQPKVQQTPQIIYPMVNPMQNYVIQLESKLKYQRVIAQKNLQLYKRQQKIKKQRIKIDRLYKELKNKQQEDELQKYINYKNEIQKMNQALTNIKDELSDRKSNFKVRKQFSEHKNDSILPNRQKRNKSEIFLSHQDKLPTISRMSENKQQKEDRSQSVQKNPEILYSPKAKNNKSSVFQNVSLYNPLVKLSQNDGHLQELMNYNKKLQYFDSKNKLKLQKIK